MDNVRPLPNLSGVILEEKQAVKIVLNEERLRHEWGLTSKTMDALFPVFQRANLLIQISNLREEH